MKLFKGDMSLWKQLSDKNSLTAQGGLLDAQPTSYRTGFVLLSIGFFTYFIYFNVDDASVNFITWLHKPIYWFISNSEWSELPPSIKIHHFYAYIFLSISTFLACLHFFSVWSTRRRARKSAAGQWYDKPGLTKADLYGKAHQDDDDHHPLR